jgi:hypothetical protein
MKIQEILDSTLPFKVVRNNNHAYDVTFTAGNREIVFTAENEEAYVNDQNDEEHYDDEYDEGNWVIAFGEKIKRHTVAADGSKGKEYDAVDFGKTKGGKEFDVFATLKAILKQFIAEKKPVRIGFTADKSDGNRARLYAKLFKKNLPRGWSMDEKEDDDEYMPQTIFTMVREDVIDDWLSLDTIKKIWHDANDKVFDDELTMPKLTLEDDLNYLARRFGPDAQEESKHGDMLGYCDKEGSRIILRFSKKIRNVNELLETVVHEMVHQAEAERIGWLKMLRDPHGEEFLAWEDRVKKYHNVSLRQIIGAK